MYYPIFCIFYLLSLLPFWALYRLSDGLFFLLYHVIGYRKKVVFDNLRQAFPEQPVTARKRMARRFYLGLTDQMLETIKMMSISKRQIRKRFIYDNNVFAGLEEKGKTCQVLLGHFFNWEWANLYLRLITKRPLLIAYKPPSNKTTDRLFRYMRSRFGSAMVSSINILPEMEPYKEKTYTSVLVTDQNPPNPRRAYWFPFMNKMTSFFKGPELTARRNNLAVVFGNIRKIKRGYYQIETTLAFEHAKETDKGEITEAFVRFLEDCIHRQPENWLWSHKRWKRAWQGEANN